VWETFAQDTTVFVPPQQQPAAWCAQNAGKPKVLSQIAKASPQVLPGMPPFGLGMDMTQAIGGVLTDQHGRFVRYELLMNQTEYTYILSNTLWNKQGQAAFTGTITFPPGSIEIKAAWKVLSEAEIATQRFYMSQATVYNDANGDSSPGKNPVTIGLVGLHIVFKDPNLHQLWATFEHVDNAPTVNTHEMTKAFSFYNPQCKPLVKCVPNFQTARQPYTELDAQGKPRNAPVQVVRTTAVASTDGSAPAFNTYYQSLLQGSVWANYGLVSLQWQTGTASAGTPTVLANTTIETFIQREAPLVLTGQAKPSSCIGCHKQAVTTAKQPADMSFLLGEAQ